MISKGNIDTKIYLRRKAGGPINVEEVVKVKTYHLQRGIRPECFHNWVLSNPQKSDNASAF